VAADAHRWVTQDEEVAGLVESFTGGNGGRGALGSRKEREESLGRGDNWASRRSQAAWGGLEAVMAGGSSAVPQLA
jgi:hypothetical protein